MARKKKRPQHDICTVLRVKLVTHRTQNLVTGEVRDLGQETVTEACGTPLFSDRDRASGVCGSCRGGFEAESNRFASDEERRRAAAS